MKHTSTPHSAAYSPTLFLASVGSGGLTVTFFMYLMFWVPHPGQPVPVFQDIATAFNQGYLPMQIAIAVAMVGIAVFAFLNIKSLFWNLAQLSQFKTTKGYKQLKTTNGETQLLAMPLALAMTINVMFILGLVFVPNLWTVVEYLFPFAMIGFVLVGLLALRMIAQFLGRVLSSGGVFDMTANNSFAQLLPAFSLAMVAVGMSAPAAMSQSTTVVGTSLVISTFFGAISAIYAIIAAIIALNSMLHYGTAKEASPTLLIIVPLMTVLGIMALRQNHGLHVAFDSHTQAADTFMFLTKLLTVQLLFGLLGLTVLRVQGYASEFLTGAKTSAGSYALVCPGVALSVMLHFWINKGLVANGLVDKFSTGYWAFTAIAIAFQFAMIALIWHLSRRQFGTATLPKATAAQ